MGGGAITDGTVEWELIKDGDMPSSVYETYTVTVGSGWQTETLGYAPADGYLVVLFVSSDTATQQIGVQTRNISDYCYNHSYHTKGTGNIYLTANSPIKMGEPISIGYLYAQSVTVYFYYTVNSAKELGLI